jgi:hypothetical protein
MRVIDWISALAIMISALSPAADAQNGAASGDSVKPGAITCADSPSVQLTGSPSCVIFARRPFASAPGGAVTWTLETFPSRGAAEQAASSSNVVATADGRAWLFTVGEHRVHHPGATEVAVVGPMPVPAAAGYEAVFAYLVVPPGSHSQVHTHSGPEGWYVVSGSQCLETPSTTLRLTGGHGGFVGFDMPMYLTVTGITMRHAFFLVFHDAKRPFNTVIDSWTPTGICNR